jgi:hypothetical protein
MSFAGSVDLKCNNNNNNHGTRFQETGKESNGSGIKAEQRHVSHIKRDVQPGVGHVCGRERRIVRRVANVCACVQGRGMAQAGVQSEQVPERDGWWRGGGKGEQRAPCNWGRGMGLGWVGRFG